MEEIRSYDFREIAGIVRESIESCIENRDFEESKLKLWPREICKCCLTALLKRDEEFKYIVTCTVLRKQQGLLMYNDAACYWNNTTDGNFFVRWENDFVFCVVTVFRLESQASEKAN